jgi:3-hydroxyacyl-CoA dehydrogenase
MSFNVENVVVIGGGVMGSAIAQVFHTFLTKTQKSKIVIKLKIREQQVQDLQ